MDITPYASAIVASVLAGGATYGAVMGRLSKLEARVDSLERSQMDVHALSNQITALSTKLDELKADVNKHNEMIERTYRLESETREQWSRINELRGELHDVKVGGTR